MIKKYLLLLCLCWAVQGTAIAQENPKKPISEQDYQNQTVEMADLMRANGKIYVVVAVIATIFAGLTVYLVRLDRKISAIEKQQN